MQRHDWTWRVLRRVQQARHRSINAERYYLDGVSKMFSLTEIESNRGFQVLGGRRNGQMLFPRHKVSVTHDEYILEIWPYCIVHLRICSEFGLCVHQLYHNKKKGTTYQETLERVLRRTQRNQATQQFLRPHRKTLASNLGKNLVLFVLTFPLSELTPCFSIAS